MACRKWIWVRDTAPGHHMDVDHRRVPALVKAGAVEVIEDYPVNEGPDVAPRPAKPRIDLARRGDAASPAEVPGAAKESGDVQAGVVPTEPPPPRRAMKTAAAQPTDTATPVGDVGDGPAPSAVG